VFFVDQLTHDGITPLWRRSPAAAAAASTAHAPQAALLPPPLLLPPLLLLLLFGARNKSRLVKPPFHRSFLFSGGRAPHFRNMRVGWHHLRYRPSSEQKRC
jgi:hypothetical protein